MSKINPLQAAALNEPKNTKPVVKTTQAKKPIAAKTTSTKQAVTKKPASSADMNIKVKPAASKTVKPAKTSASKKPVTMAKPKVTAKVTEPKIAEPGSKAAKEKAPKLKMERDSFTMPKTEYAQLFVLKERLIKLGQPGKKSELLRAGIMQLSAMTDAALKAAMGKVPAIKTGRPKKK